MPEKDRLSFMSRMVAFCVGFTAVMIVACYIGRWFGVDTTHELTLTVSFFGVELAGLMVKKLSAKKGEKEG